MLMQNAHALSCMDHGGIRCCLLKITGTGIQEGVDEMHDMEISITYWKFTLYTFLVCQYIWLRY